MFVLATQVARKIYTEAMAASTRTGQGSREMAIAPRASASGKP